MGFKNKMMEEMMDKFFRDMTREEKNSMMQGMMDKFINNMSAEENRK